MISSCRNAETVWKNFHGVRLLCFDKDAVSINDFLGGATIKLEDLNEPSIGTQQIKLPLKSRKGKDDGVTGYIIVESSFIEYPKDPELSDSLPDISHVPPVEKSDIIRESPSGRREVIITTKKKELVFGELPPFRLDKSIEDCPGLMRYGFNNRLALWLVTCCQLAYRTEDIVKSVCCEVWGNYQISLVFSL